MHVSRFKKLVYIIGLGGFLHGQVNCVPSKNQIYSSINGGLMGGIELALTLGVTNFLSAIFPNAGADDTTDTTTEGT